ncbi:MAG: hypothetical protein OJF49_001304 [Ktedonobacterales bacterium]|jgi:hypothetical protein|nr:MAG: hypothetical protein OJF49_001304 [Ktedonobacterales bacterium]
MADWKPTWPTRPEYDEAIKQWRTNVNDAELKAANLATMPTGGPARYGGAGLYITFYKLGNFQARCFCSNIDEHINPPTDIVERYQRISQYITAKQAEVPALIPTTYVEHGIYVAKNWRPVIKTQWLNNTRRLGSYIADYYNDTNRMRTLGEAWRQMIGQLEAVGIAHGDLDLTNVLIQEAGGQPQLRLIDYDNMWVPLLAGKAQTECGHKPFQHPQFFRPGDKPNPANRPFDAEMDRFSALVIYLSLLAISIRPALYNELGAREDERLLFSRDDYDNPTLATSNIERMRAKCGAPVEPYVRELRAALEQRRMPRSLADIASGKGAAASVPLTATPRAFVPPPPAEMSKPLGARVPIATAGPAPSNSTAQPGRAQYQLPVSPATPRPNPNWPAQPYSQPLPPVPATKAKRSGSVGTVVVWSIAIFIALLIILSAFHVI